MTDLLDRLRKADGSDEGTRWYRNPDGPEAAREIERLWADLAEAEALLRRVRFAIDVTSPQIRRLDNEIGAFLARRKAD